MLKIFQKELPSEPGTPGPDILLCCNTVYLQLPRKVTHTSTTAVCHHLTNGREGYQQDIGALSCPGTGFPLPGARCDVRFKFKGSEWLNLAMNSRVKDKLIEALSPGPLTKKTHNRTEFHRVEAFQCWTVVALELLKCK